MLGNRGVELCCVALVSGNRSVELCCVKSRDMCCVSTGGILGRVSMNSFALGPNVVMGMGVAALLGISWTRCLESN